MVFSFCKTCHDYNFDSSKVAFLKRNAKPECMIVNIGYFNGKLTASEHQELKNYLPSNPADRKIFEDYRLLWSELEIGM